MFECHICKSKNIDEFDMSNFERTISSDCKSACGQYNIGFCKNCGCIVKNPTKSWKTHVTHIYDDYDIYLQSNGKEKVVHDKRTGAQIPRSDVLINTYLDQIQPPRLIEALDIGAGTGVFLTSLARKTEHAKLYAHDLSDKNLDYLNRIPNFKGLFTEDISSLNKKFNLVSMVQVLEHVLDPIKFLSSIKSVLDRAGALIVNVPDAENSAIDLMVYDHCTHFNMGTLESIIEQAGYRVIFKSNRAIPGELVAIAVPDETVIPTPSEGFSNLSPQVAYLSKLRDAALNLGKEGNIDVFGSSIASAWISQYIENWGGCFVDEDKNRIGNVLIGHKIIGPSDVSEGNVVLVPLASKPSSEICERLSTPSVRYIAVT